MNRGNAVDKVGHGRSAHTAEADLEAAKAAINPPMPPDPPSRPPPNASNHKKVILLLETIRKSYFNISSGERLLQHLRKIVHELHRI